MVKIWLQRNFINLVNNLIVKIINILNDYTVNVIDRTIYGPTHKSSLYLQYDELTLDGQIPELD